MRELFAVRSESKKFFELRDRGETESHGQGFAICLTHFL